MNHALIIEDNMIVGHAIEEQLAHAGFGSCYHAWTEAQALGYAERHSPDLVVVGDGMEDGSGIEVAYAIGRMRHIPVLLATTNPYRSGDNVPNDLSVHGPCRIDEIEKTICEKLAGADQDSFALS